MTAAVKWAATVVTIALLASCASTGVIVPPQPQGFEPCKSSSPVAVENLRRLGPPGCDMVGMTVEFPDGATGKVGRVGANKSWSYDASLGDGTVPAHFTMVNWGAPGIAVAEQSREGWIREIWANSTEASDLLFELLEESGVPVDEPH